MIKKLRSKFILIAMVSTSLVLLIIIAAINITNYHNVVANADQQLKQLTSFSENDFDKNFSNPDFVSDINKKPVEAPNDIRNQKLGIKNEPMDFRFFAVTYANDGSISNIYIKFTSTISEATATDYAQEAYSSGQSSGFYGDFRITTFEDNSTGEITYIFLDCGRELNTCRTFFLASVGISLAGLIVVFLLIWFLSKLALRPVAESYDKQKRFITDASHEIKTPLTIIDANTEIIEMEQEENEWTQGIHNQISRLTELTNKLVFLARMDEENHSVTKLDFSLSDAIVETVEPFQPVAMSQQKTLSLDIAKELSYEGDESQIRQMVSLLVDNAIKYSKEQGNIRVSLKEEKKNKIITVWNELENNSISKGSHDELFERFYRMDKSRNSKTGGHGIGLSVAEAIAHAHKGKITAKSVDGSSIMFTIVL